MLLENLTYLLLVGTLAGLYYGLNMFPLFGNNTQVVTNRKTVILLVVISTFVVSNYISAFLISLTLLSVMGGIFGGFVGKMIYEKIQYKADMESLKKLSHFQSNTQSSSSAR